MHFLEYLFQHGLGGIREGTEFLDQSVVHLGVAENMASFEALKLYLSCGNHPLSDF